MTSAAATCEQTIGALTKTPPIAPTRFKCELLLFVVHMNGSEHMQRKLPYDSMHVAQECLSVALYHCRMKFAVKF